MLVRPLAQRHAPTLVALSLCILPSAPTRASGEARTDAPAPAAPAPAAPAPDTAPALRRMTFAEAVQESLQRNPGLRVAELEIARAQALVRQAQAAFLPTLTGNGTYTRLDDDRRSATGGQLLGKDQVNLNALLTVPLFLPQKWQAESRAKLNTEAVQLTAQDQRRQTALATGRAFLTVVAAQRQVEVATRARKNAEDHQAFSSKRFGGGLGNRLDLVRADQDLATTVAALQTQLVALARAREALAILVGADGPVDAAGDPQLPEPPQLGEALQQARIRPDVVAQEKRQKIADQLLDDRWSLYAPILQATFQPIYQNPITPTQPTTGWQAQLVLTLPLYDGGLRYGQIREQRTLAQEAREQLDGSLRQASSEVRAAFEALRLADQALVSTREASRLAAESQKLSEDSYQAGAITELEVLDASRRARDAEAATASAEDAARQARIELLAAAGRFP